VDEGGSALVTLRSPGKPDADLRLEKELTAPARGARPVLTRNGDPFSDWGIVGSTAAAVSLALGMLVSMTNLRRAMRSHGARRA